MKVDNVKKDVLNDWAEAFQGLSVYAQFAAYSLKLPFSISFAISPGNSRSLPCSHFKRKK